MATGGGKTYMSTHSKTLKKAVCVAKMAYFSMFLPHFCLQNPYLWGVSQNLVDALQIMHYPPSASTLSFSSNYVLSKAQSHLVEVLGPTSSYNKVLMWAITSSRTCLEIFSINIAFLTFQSRLFI